MKKLLTLRRYLSVALTVSAVSLPLLSCANNPSFIVVHESDSGAMQNLVHGKLVSKNTDMPIAGATVYVPKDITAEKKPLSDLSLNSAIEQTMGCKAPSEPYASFACTDDYGNFTIAVTSASNFALKLKFQHEKSIISTDLSLDDLDSDIGTIAFTTMNQIEEKKKIAIVLDLQSEYSQMSNSMDDIIPHNLKVEFEQEFSKMYEIDENQYDVEFMAFNSLFEDKDDDKRSDIFNYAMVYLITPGNEDLSDINKEYKLTLLDFISKGGELFVTTLSVEAEEPSLEEFI